MNIFREIFKTQRFEAFERQSKNQANILKDTALLIDRLNNFVKTYDGIGNKIKELTKSYTDSLSKLRDNNQSVLKTGKKVAEAIGKETKFVDLLLEKDDYEIELPQLVQEETQIPQSNQLQSGEETDYNKV